MQRNEHPRSPTGYKFNVFYPDLIDQSKPPRYYLENDGESRDHCLIRCVRSLFLRFISNHLICLFAMWAGSRRGLRTKMLPLRLSERSGNTKLWLFVGFAALGNPLSFCLQGIQSQKRVQVRV